MTMDPQSETDITVATGAATGWVIALSVGLILLGMASIVMPGVALALFTVLVGWIALVGGIFQIIQSFKARALRSMWLTLVVGVFYTVAGFYSLANPVKSAAVFALAFGLLFIGEGIVTIAMAFTHKAGRSMSWLVAINGIITLILGILVINRWPIGAMWLIGLYLGISLLLSGASLLGAALVARKEAA